MLHVNPRINPIEKTWFGTMPDGREAYAYALFDEKGQCAVISEYGCAIQKLLVNTPDGKQVDVALGYDRLEDYIADTRHFGVTVGRYANRIAHGRFTIDEVDYLLPRNNGEHCLHGGRQGFDKRLFASDQWEDSVIFSYFSPDLEEGFPGNLTLTVTVTFSKGALRFLYEYECDHACPVSITNHCYFNLNGHGTGTILGHKVKVNADSFCHADDGLLAIAPPASVEGTPFDLRNSRPILDGLMSHSQDIIRAGGGYDHCFALNSGDPAAEAIGENGLKMEVRTDMPALQFYSGNQIGRVVGKGGAVYNTFDGFALECQQFPNAMNEPSFPSPIIQLGDKKSAFLEYRFL